MKNFDEWIDAIECSSLVKQEMYDIHLISNLGLEHKFLLICSIDENLLYSKLEFLNLSAIAKQIIHDLVYNKHRCIKCSINMAGKGRIGTKKNLQKKIQNYIVKRFKIKRAKTAVIITELESFVSNMPRGTLFEIIN